MCVMLKGKSVCQHFPAINTLRISVRDTPSFDTPLVTAYGEGTRQKILIRQVFVSPTGQKKI
jgi:hypothetical protein